MIIKNKYRSSRQGLAFASGFDKKSQEYSAIVNDASDIHGALIVLADEATFAKTQATKASNYFFKRNHKHKKLSAIAKAPKTGFIYATTKMNTVMKALNLIEMNGNLHQDYEFFDDVSDRLLDKEQAHQSKATRN